MSSVNSDALVALEARADEVERERRALSVELTQLSRGNGRQSHAAAALTASNATLEKELVALRLRLREVEDKTRCKFGSRGLDDASLVFEQNAWDDVPLDSEMLREAALQIEDQAAHAVDDE